MEAQAAKLVDGGDKNGGRNVLTEFVGKTNETMAACQQMQDFLNGLPFLKNR
jgi:hypothetical protein